MEIFEKSWKEAKWINNRTSQLVRSGGLEIWEGLIDSWCRKAGCYWKKDRALKESVSASKWKGVVCEKPPERGTPSVRGNLDQACSLGEKHSRENTQEKGLNMSLVWKMRDCCGWVWERVKKGGVKLVVKGWVEEKIEFQKSQIPQKKLARGGWREINERVCEGGEGHSRDSRGDSIFSNCF